MTYLKGGNSHLKKNKSLEELEKAKKEQDSKKLYSYSRGSALEKVIN